MQLSFLEVSIETVYSFGHLFEDGRFGIMAYVVWTGLQNEQYYSESAAPNFTSSERVIA